MKKILIIEDDRFLLELLSKKLTAAGYKVTGAVDGQEGVDAVGKDLPDLVLLDLMLPVLDGFEWLRRIRKDEKTAKLNIIVISNLGGADDIAKAKDLGVMEYLVKANFTTDEILTKVKNALA